MKSIKQILTSIAVGGLLCLSAFGQINVASPTATFTASTNFAGTNILSQLITNSAKISRIQLLNLGGAAIAPTIQFYDSTNLVTNYSYAAFTNRIEYTTNLVTTYVSPLTGTTNIQTNLVWFETNVVTASNLVQIPFKSYPALSNVLSTFDVNLLVSKGLLVYSPATNVQVFVTYRPND